jgi:hypothetical protein
MALAPVRVVLRSMEQDFQGVKDILGCRHSYIEGHIPVHGAAATMDHQLIAPSGTVGWKPLDLLFSCGVGTRRRTR